jgi:hypothetical protein
MREVDDPAGGSAKSGMKRSAIRQLSEINNGSLSKLQTWFVSSRRSIAAAQFLRAVRR